MAGSLAQQVFQGERTASRLPFVKGTKTLTVAVQVPADRAADPNYTFQVVPLLRVNEHWRELQPQTWKGGLAPSLAWGVPGNLAAPPDFASFTVINPAAQSVGGQLALS